jgi:hypothetical protein
MFVKGVGNIRYAQGEFDPVTGMLVLDQTQTEGATSRKVPAGVFIHVPSRTSGTVVEQSAAAVPAKKDPREASRSA